MLGAEGSISSLAPHWGHKTSQLHMTALGLLFPFSQRKGEQAEHIAQCRKGWPCSRQRGREWREKYPCLAGYRDREGKTAKVGSKGLGVGHL